MNKRPASLSSLARGWLAITPPNSQTLDFSSFVDNAVPPKGRRWQVARTKSVLLAEFPEGVPPDLSDKAVQRRLEQAFKTNGWKLPSIDTIARARGRRKLTCH